MVVGVGLGGGEVVVNCTNDDEACMLSYPCTTFLLSVRVG